MNENIIAKGVLKGALYVLLLSLILYSIYLLKSIILYIFLAAVVSLIGRPFVIFFVKKLWPDFTKNDFYKIIEKYKKINRKFGGI